MHAIYYHAIDEAGNIVYQGYGVAKDLPSAAAKLGERRTYADIENCGAPKLIVTPWYCIVDNHGNIVTQGAYTPRRARKP